MVTTNRRILFAVLLIAAGVLFLLQNVGLIPNLAGVFWGALFALGGLAFLSVLFTNRSAWWAAIPGIILLDLGALIVFSELFPALGDRAGGSFFLAGIGLAFIVVYLLQPQMWWAIIPAGTMLTLAVVAGIDSVTPGIETGGVFFLGLGATFALLALVGAPPRRLNWAWIPAGVLLVMGILLTFSAGESFKYLWPVVLILVGGFLLFRAFIRPRTM